ncbi:MAG: hypothetical protein AAF997_06100 [Myxococcota bacterium]
MWDLEMATDTLTMFFKGKLFKDMKQFARQSAIGIVLTAALLFGLSFTGLPILAVAGIAGFLGGVFQPYLFKDLKYQ